MTDLFATALKLADPEPPKTPPRPTLTKSGHIIHRCWCGAWGAFGYGVRITRDIPGSWFCGQHRPKGNA